MAKMKEFFGNDVSDAINQACSDFSVSQDDLDINVLETGSAGIFGLCKKKAHIQASLKDSYSEPVSEVSVEKKTEKKKRPPKKQNTINDIQEITATREVSDLPGDADDESETEDSAPEFVERYSKTREEKFEIPSDEALESIRADVEKLLSLMGFPSDVKVNVDEYTVQCTISGEFDEDVIGTEGRTLDSLQYLVRKMVNRRLPDRMPLYLDAGNYRERRVDELRDRATELAAQVKEDGKTQAIAALNPSERRVVHMALQDDKAIRSRSVGDGLFKKVLIYKPGKGRKSGSKSRRGPQGGRPVNKQE
jgi:spoIIIJ-associated protein